MKKIIVLGNKGMLGHVLETELRKDEDYEVIGLNREHLDMLEFGTLEAIIKSHNPDFVINCVGVLKRGITSTMYAEANVILPRMLNRMSVKLYFKLINISTNCVFEDIGPHTVNDSPSATDMYGMSKAFGEILDNGNLTIRTSITGPERKKYGTGLMHQFITNDEFIDGYATTMWNGVTTLEFAKFIPRIMKHRVGVIHYFSKYEDNKLSVLDTINETFNIGKTLNVVYNDEAHHALLDGKYFTEKPYDIQFQELKQWMIENKDLYEEIYDENIYV